MDWRASRLDRDSGSNPIAFSQNEARQWKLNAKDYTDGTNWYPGRYAWVFASQHPAGAQFVFGDGSVKFISETIEYLTYCRLAYIHDGETVGPY